MEKYRIISDIFAVPGLFCLFLGILRWMAGQGAYQGIRYILGNALRLLTFQQAKPYRPEKIKQNGYAVLLVVGAILLAVAGIFAGITQ